jgi:hypothetical protein
VIDDAELVAAIAGRAHWQLDELGAVYAPPGAAAHVRVRPVRTPARARERYLVSVIKGQAETVDADAHRGGRGRLG